MDVAKETREFALLAKHRENWEKILDQYAENGFVTQKHSDSELSEAPAMDWFMLSGESAAVLETTTFSNIEFNPIYNSIREELEVG